MRIKVKLRSLAVLAVRACILVFGRCNTARLLLFIENPISFFSRDRVFVHRRNDPVVGIGSHALVYLSIVRMCQEVGIKAMFDGAYYRSKIYHQDGANLHNFWAQYFEQTDQGALIEARSKPGWLMSRFSSNFFPGYEIDISDTEVLDEYKDVFRSAISLRKEHVEYFDGIARQLEIYDKPTIGVSLRYSNLGGAKRHHVQPDVDELILRTQRLVDRYGIAQIFLAVEHDRAIEAFREVFGDRLVTLDRPRIPASGSDNKNSVEQTEFLKAHTTFEPSSSFDAIIDFKDFGRDDDQFLKTVEYLGEIYCLSRCDHLCCGVTSGSALAYLLKEGQFKTAEFLDLGFYE